MPTKEKLHRLSNTQVKDQIVQAVKGMTEKHKLWERLNNQYRLEYELPGYRKEEIVRISRMYAMGRNLVSSVAFNYPRVYIKPKPHRENLERNVSHAAMILERAAQLTIERIKLRLEVHQCIFDTLFTGCGWLKIGWNPAGIDLDMPFALHNRFPEQFPFITRVDPRKVFISRLTQPQSIAMCPLIIEEVWSPLEFVLNDDRIDKKVKDQIRTASAEDTERYRASMGDDLTPGEKSDEYKKALEQNKMVLMYEVHDPVRRNFQLHIEGVEEAARNEIHPFIEVETSETIVDGQVEETVQPKTSFLVENGYQYMPLRFDLDTEFFWPEPPFAYVEDTQLLQVESLTRRLDQLKRFSRIAKLAKDEEVLAPMIRKRLANARDGDTLVLEDPNSLQPMDWGSVGNDQLQLESDARQYESETLETGDLASGSSRKSATEVAVTSAKGTLNREWMQAQVGELYRLCVVNILSMLKDKRFQPKDLILNTAPEGGEEVLEVLTSKDFDFHYEVDIDVESMQPLREEVEQDRATVMYDRLIGNPLIDQEELTRVYLNSQRVRNVERLFKGRGETDAVRSAQLEVVGFLMRGTDPGVVPGENHQVHMQYQHPDAIMQYPDFQQMLPAQQQQVLQLAAQHYERHQQQLVQETSPQSGSVAANAPGQIQQGSESLSGMVKSNAQETSNALQADAGALTRQGA